jgi:hypothetical protein
VQGKRQVCILQGLALLPGSGDCVDDGVSRLARVGALGAALRRQVHDLVAASPDGANACERRR